MYPVKAVAVSLLRLVTGAVIFHLTAVLFGAPLIEKFQRTLVWSAMMSCLSLMPLLTRPLDLQGSMHIFLIGTGAWIGALVIPLDWNYSWQAWPLPSCIGACCGFTLSVLLSSWRNTKPTTLDAIGPNI